MSFPSNSSSLVWSRLFGQTGLNQTLYGNSAPPGVWIPAFDCHRAGRLPSGSYTQEAVHSCWSLVTPYPGGGSISMAKQHIPRLWLMASKFDENVSYFPKS